MKTSRQAKYTYSCFLFHFLCIYYISCFIYISNAHSKYLPLLDNTSYCIISFIWAFFTWELNRSSVHNAGKPRLANTYWDGSYHVWPFYLPILFDYTKHQALCFLLTKWGDARDPVKIKLYYCFMKLWNYIHIVACISMKRPFEELLMKVCCTSHHLQSSFGVYFSMIT